MTPIITSRANNKVLKVLDIYKNQNKVESKFFINESLVNLKETAKLDMVEEVYMTENWINKLPPEALNCPYLYFVKENVMDKMSHLKDSNGVLFIAKKPEYKAKENKKIIYLDDVQDPGNVGTIIRTALAFNFDEVVLSEKSANLYNPKVLSASRCALYKIEVKKASFSHLRDAHLNHQVIATTLSDKSIELSDLKEHSESFILVLGNEGHGVSEEILKNSDIDLKISMHEIDSLNVAASAAIFAYYLSK